MADVGKGSFYVDVNENGFYNFYYNMVAQVNEAVVRVLRDDLNLRPISSSAQAYIQGRQAGGLRTPSKGPAMFGVMGNRNQATGELEFMSALDMQGITAAVNASLAEEILALSNYYCPVDTGRLRDSGRIEQNPDGSCRIFYDCSYAWYVHEFSWKNHAYPTRDHFLTEAIYVVEKLHGIGWA